jgi:hypothetical protein
MKVHVSGHSEYCLLHDTYISVGTAVDLVLECVHVAIINVQHCMWPLS